MDSLRVVAVLGLLFASLQSAVSIDSNCVSHLPQSENELWSLAKGSTQTLQTVTRDQQQQRLFPNVTFNCNGSIVGWSMIASLLSKRGGRPVISVWRPMLDNNMRFQRVGNTSRLLPCLKRHNDTLYLYKNITEQPVEFQKGDFLGMLLRHPDKTQYEPYFIHNESFYSYYDDMGRRNPQQYDELVNDSKMPLLFLHICSKENGVESYDRCIESYSSPPQCIDPTSSVPSGGDDDDDDDDDGGGISRTVLATAVVVPLGLVLLTITVVLVVVLLYIWLVRRGRGRRRTRDGNKSHDVTENNGAIGEAEPYAEPVIRLSPSLPPPRTQTPLPPPPTHAPPPVPGLSVKHTYDVLERPTPSPPPPYDLNLEHNKSMRPTLQSPEYESIDKTPSKMALVRQNATETITNSASYGMQQQ